ncbi:MAG: class I adenylate-forming enzyme family protein [Alphaproteobacteria bacterium]
MDLSAWIERNADFAPERVAVHFETEAITYRELAARIGAAARVLKHELGVGRGDRVAYLGFNSPEFLTLLFAAARLGVMVVPLNWRLAVPEHDYILADAAVSALFCEPEFREHAAAACARLEDCKRVAIRFSDPGWLDYARLAQAASGDDRNPHVSHESPLLVVYTSGTTGHPKGAVLTQSALFWNAVNSTHMHDLTSTDRVLTVLPMFHVGGLNIQTLPALHAGATVTLHRRFDAAATLEAIQRTRPTLLVLVPATIQALLDAPGWAGADLSSLRMVTTGSTVVPLHLIEGLHRRGVPVVQVYGLTETSPIAAYLRREDAERKIGSTGKAALHCELRIVDDAGNDVPPGTPGEILVRGPNVLFEYWGNEQATREALVDGWFRTGDVGYADEDGYLYFVERKNDVIVSGGENVYPAEIERILLEQEDIAEAAVVARPDARWGEVPVAIVVPRPGVALSRDDILRLFEGRLARFKHPQEARISDALPRNAMGKVLRYELREQERDAQARGR